MAWRQAGTSFGTPPPVELHDGSTSTSGVPVNLASVNSPAGYKLIGWSLFAAQSNTASSQLQITITYSDSTTTVLQTTSGVADTVRGNRGGLTIYAPGLVSFTAIDPTKAVTGITIATFGAGLGPRAAMVSALQVPQ